jgi:hypothetical protein
VLGYKVMISDREKTAIDCIDHPPLAGGVGEAATLATASRRFDWTKAADYLERIGSPARWCADLAGSPITSRPIFRPPMRERLLAWRRGAAKLGSAPRPNTVCRERSVMTRPGVCS